MTYHKVKEQYLEQLRDELNKHSEKEEILLDYDQHISELVNECDVNIETEQEWMFYITHRLGTPKGVARIWQEELSVSQNKTLLYFLFVNLLFFFFGGLLTLLHFTLGLQWFTELWRYLTSIPTLLMFLYMFFWGLLGYEIGKGFGANGEKLMKKTFTVAIIPNLMLLILVLFKIIPYDWFEPLLTRSFIWLCITSTVLLYPISYLGFRWGKKKSV
ncbi:HAAS signaling domain-containing protein [Chengkuizengella axinellae]|uniref:DUF1700 domain-containing protein n=1 Tax=Chengkuizengella axinellae TaxID=3064388 RepID=A0ABT9J1F6_9BACL|nr:hypothetical protein [Chengkuizengella sp. 2205SS18-9]MDP5275449.1 hypothetical protein [Chengkuizengella sp. 2205SS18-9]